MSRLTLLGSILCVAVAGVCSSCNSSFDQRWKATPPMAAANPAALMVGKWEGTWQSDATDYEGWLQALVTAAGVTVDDKKTVQKYTVEFRYHFFKMAYEERTVTLNAIKGDDNRLHFTGKKDLGLWRGGIIRFEGYVDPEKDIFYLDYVSEKDAGTYKMHRIVTEDL